MSVHTKAILIASLASKRGFSLTDGSGGSFPFGAPVRTLGAEGKSEAARAEVEKGEDGQGPPRGWGTTRNKTAANTGPPAAGRSPGCSVPLPSARSGPTRRNYSLCGFHLELESWKLLLKGGRCKPLGQRTW